MLVVLGFQASQSFNKRNVLPLCTITLLRGNPIDPYFLHAFRLFQFGERFVLTPIEFITVEFALLLIFFRTLKEFRMPLFKPYPLDLLLIEAKIAPRAGSPPFHVWRQAQPGILENANDVGANQTVLLKG